MERYISKLHQAEQIIESLKEQLLNIFWESMLHEYNAERSLIGWMEEEAVYSIQKLDLNAADEALFLRQVHHIFGEYSEVMPRLKRSDD